MRHLLQRLTAHVQRNVVEYPIVVEACDLAAQCTEKVYVVLILDQNTAAPRFVRRLPFEVAITENDAAAGFVLESTGDWEYIDQDVCSENRAVVFGAAPAADEYAVRADNGRLSLVVAVEVDGTGQAFVELSFPVLIENVVPLESGLLFAGPDELDVALTVQDSNDERPEWNFPQSDPIWTVRAEENRAYPQLFPDPSQYPDDVALASDADTVGTILYSIASSQPGGGGFVVDAETGFISCPELDRESPGAPEYVVQIRADDGVHLRILRTVRITVADSNDSPPVFSQQVYEAEPISETAPVGTEVITVVAADDDEVTSANSRITCYSITGGDPKGYFRFRDCTGTIVTQRALEADTVGEDGHLRLTVQATDGGFPIQSGEAIVNVFIVDANENAPYFVFSEEGDDAYFADLTENSPPGTLVLPFYVADDDRDSQNRALSVQITAASPAAALQFFQVIPVDQHNFELRVSKAGLDREDPTLVADSQITLELLARDALSELRSAPVEVQIRVLDQDDNRPTLQDLTITVPEDIGGVFLPNKVIGQLIAADDDTGVNRELRFYGAESPYVSINVLSGQVVQLKRFDFTVNQDTTHIIETWVQDRGSPCVAPGLEGSDGCTSARAQLVIIVQDVNEAPSFPFPPFVEGEIQENPGLFDRTVKEPGTGLPLEIEAGDPDSERFGTIVYSINSVQGQGIMGSFTCFAGDSGCEQSNDKWPFELVAPMAPDPNTRYLRVRSAASFDSIDRETYSRYTVVISAQDSPGLVSGNQLTVNIVVTDRDDNDLVFPEADGAGSIVFAGVPENVSPLNYELRVSDPDLGENGAFECAFGPEGSYQNGPAAALMDIASAPGSCQITVRAPGLDADAPYVFDGAFRFQVTATNPYSASAPVAAVVVVFEMSDSNDNCPEFTRETFGGQIREGALGDNVVVMTAVDADRIDSYTTVLYSFAVADAFTRQHVRVDAVSGGVSVVAPFNREDPYFSQSEHVSFTVSAVNPAACTGTPAIATVSIRVIDEDDNAPVFSPDSAIISKPEDGPSFAPPQTIYDGTGATDSDVEDANSDISYSIRAGDVCAGSPCDEMFDVTYYVQGQRFFVRQLLPIDAEAEFNVPERDPRAATGGVVTVTVYVVATDAGGNSDTFQLTIEVLDRNDNSPFVVVQGASGALDEWTPTTPVADFRATPVAGIKVETKDLDYQDRGGCTEAQQEYLFTCTLHYEIVDIDWLAAGLDMFQFDDATGTLYPGASLSDADIMSTFDGERLRRETGSNRIAVTFRAVDSASTHKSAPHTVIVELVDRNDNSPVFGPCSFPSGQGIAGQLGPFQAAFIPPGVEGVLAVYEVTIPEDYACPQTRFSAALDSCPGNNAVVTCVRAEDADEEGPNSAILYEATFDGVKKPFRVTVSDGEVVVSGDPLNLDDTCPPDRTRTYTGVVTATDAGGGDDTSRSEMANLRIIVTRVNDVRPMWLYPSETEIITTRMAEDEQPGYVILDLREYVIDGDISCEALSEVESPPIVFSLATSSPEPSKQRFEVSSEGLLRLSDNVCHPPSPRMVGEACILEEDPRRALGSCVPIDFDSQEDKFQIVVQADDGLSNEPAWVEVSLVGRNDNCPQMASAIATMSEDAEPGFEVHTFAATDGDGSVEGDLSGGGAFEYSLVESTYSGYFSIGLVDGVVRLVDGLFFDREQLGSFQITARATDNRNPVTGGSDDEDRLSVTSTLTIFLADVDDVAPSFDASATARTGAVREGQPAPMLVAWGDAGVSYVKEGQGAFETQFPIYDGDATQKNRFIRSVSIVSAVPAYATSGTSASCQAQEDDCDALNPMDAFSVSFTRTNGQPAALATVTVNQELNSEASRFYRLVIRAEDAGGNSADATFTVLVVDVNDEGPVFENAYSGQSVDEDAEIGTLIGQFPAKDLDAEPRLTYTLTYGGEAEPADSGRPQADFYTRVGDADLFYLDNHTGALFLAGPLDRSLSASYSLGITVSDGVHSDKRELLVTVNPTQRPTGPTSTSSTTTEPTTPAVPSSYVIATADAGGSLDGGVCLFPFQTEASTFMYSCTAGQSPNAYFCKVVDGTTQRCAITEVYQLDCAGEECSVVGEDAEKPLDLEPDRTYGFVVPEDFEGVVGVLDLSDRLPQVVMTHGSTTEDFFLAAAGATLLFTTPPQMASDVKFELFTFDASAQNQLLNVDIGTLWNRVSELRIPGSELPASQLTTALVCEESGGTPPSCTLKTCQSGEEDCPTSCAPGVWTITKQDGTVESYEGCTDAYTSKSGLQWCAVNTNNIMWGLGAFEYGTCRGDSSNAIESDAEPLFPGAEPDADHSTAAAGGIVAAAAAVAVLAVCIATVLVKRRLRRARPVTISELVHPAPSAMAAPPRGRPAWPEPLYQEVAL